MNLGESLVQAGLVTTDDIASALERQGKKGGALGQALISLGVITADQLEAHFRAPPPILFSVADTGLRQDMLTGLVLKYMHQFGTETPSAIAQQVKLPAPTSMS